MLSSFGELPMTEAKPVKISPGKAPLAVPVYLSRSAGDRVLLGVFAPVVAALTGGLAFFAHLFGPSQPDIVIRVGAQVVADFSFTFFSFSILVFIWALFMPAWVERLLASRARRVMLTAAFLVTGAALGAIYFSS